jgi:GTPase SAR1 family protein
LDAVLIGLKADIQPANRAVSTEDITALVHRFKIRRYFEVSAMENRNVHHAFENLATHLMLNRHQRLLEAEKKEKQQENAVTPEANGWNMCVIS